MAATVFPAINAAGIITQYPYQETDDFIVASVSLDCGITITRSQNATTKRRFVLRYPLIQREEVTILEEFFLDRRGRVKEFTFTDDEGVDWERTRFNQDRLEVTYNEPASYSMEIHLITLFTGSGTGAGGLDEDKDTGGSDDGL